MPSLFVVMWLGAAFFVGFHVREFFGVDLQLNLISELAGLLATAAVASPLVLQRKRNLQLRLIEFKINCYLLIRAMRLDPIPDKDFYKIQNGDFSVLFSWKNPLLYSKWLVKAVFYLYPSIVEKELAKRIKKDLCKFKIKTNKDLEEIVYKNFFENFLTVEIKLKEIFKTLFTKATETNLRKITKNSEGKFIFKKVELKLKSKTLESSDFIKLYKTAQKILRQNHHERFDIQSDQFQIKDLLAEIVSYQDLSGILLCDLPKEWRKFRRVIQLFKDEDFQKLLKIILDCHFICNHFIDIYFWDPCEAHLFMAKDHEIVDRSISGEEIINIQCSEYVRDGMNVITREKANEAIMEKLLLQWDNDEEKAFRDLKQSEGAQRQTLKNATEMLNKLIIGSENLFA